MKDTLKPVMSALVIFTAVMSAFADAGTWEDVMFQKRPHLPAVEKFRV